MVDFFNSKELLIDGIGKLKSSKIPSPEIDARILLSYASNYHNTFTCIIIFQYQKRIKINFIIF